jgi:hypothetical protein
VAPSGMPVGDPEAEEPSVPSGDVAPRAGEVEIALFDLLCAWPAPQLSRIAAIVRSNRVMNVPCSDGRDEPELRPRSALAEGRGAAISCGAKMVERASPVSLRVLTGSRSDLILM